MGILEKHSLKETAKRLLMVLAIVAFVVSGQVNVAYAAMPAEEPGDVGVIPELPSTGTGVEIDSYREEKIEEIPYKTLYQYSSSLAWGETRVEVEGEAGTRRVIGTVITEDGKIVSREEISSKVLREPTDEVILIGSFSALPETEYDFPPILKVSDVCYDSSVYVELKNEYTQDNKSGQAICEFALQYLGNPYVWGGTSLTSGTDCSGFVYSVFNSLGYDVPRVGVENVYPISVDEMLPGDVIAYPDHYAIYIGGGLEVGALNWSNGICITPVGYVGEGYIAVRIAD